jgi:hypothetical protein
LQLEMLQMMLLLTDNKTPDERASSFRATVLLTVGGYYGT